MTIPSMSSSIEVFWPFGLGEQVVDVALQLHRGEVRLDVEDTSFLLGDCLLVGSELAASAPGHWIVDKGCSALASLVQPVLDTILCNALRHQIGTMEASSSLFSSLPRDFYNGSLKTSAAAVKDDPRNQQGTYEWVNVSISSLTQS
ncbi:unnamed protein product [Strongylus vulgaris]|uniref:Uncharacterized protein n=1 Tax=Strongylus vulgaris TaxID=40348 RepID=A0A3P7IV70_STRVU|nr:unnamed protein product [Strongylus vulgaris]